jgi:hypothetical protein
LIPTRIRLSPVGVGWLSDVKLSSELTVQRPPEVPTNSDSQSVCLIPLRQAHRHELHEEAARINGRLIVFKTDFTTLRARRVQLGPAW